jgi:anti-sigma factor RsiW
MEAFIDGELPRSEAGQLEFHVRRCPACRHELALASRIADGLRTLPRKRFPEGGVDTAIDSPDPMRRRETPLRRGTGGGANGWFHHAENPWRRPALAAGFLVLLVAGTLFVARPRHSGVNVDRATVIEAEAAVKWTLAYIDEVGRQAGLTFRNDVLDARIIAPAERAVGANLGERSHSSPSSNGGS